MPDRTEARDYLRRLEQAGIARAQAEAMREEIAREQAAKTGLEGEVLRLARRVGQLEREITRLDGRFSLLSWRYGAGIVLLMLAASWLLRRLLG